MDLDKAITFFKAVGFPSAVAVWFLWKIQAFLDLVSTQQVTIIELLRQLIAK